MKIFRENFLSLSKFLISLISGFSTFHRNNLMVRFDSTFLFTKVLIPNSILKIHTLIAQNVKSEELAIFLQKCPTLTPVRGNITNIFLAHPWFHHFFLLLYFNAMQIESNKSLQFRDTPISRLPNGRLSYLVCLNQQRKIANFTLTPIKHPAQTPSVVNTLLNRALSLSQLDNFKFNYI